MYEWGEGQALKLYYEGFPSEWIHHEAEIGRMVQAAGVPAPKVYDVIAENGRRGLVYERIDGPSLLRAIQASPLRMKKYVREMARLHADIHRCSSPELPRQKEYLTQAIQVSHELLGDRMEAILEYLETLPEGIQVCHGDFHPDNVLLSAGQLVAIDWTNAHSGNPLEDAARTSLMFLSPFTPPGTSPVVNFLLRRVRPMMNRTYLKEYCRTSRTCLEDVHAWLLPVLAARLRENVPGEREWLLRLIDQQLATLTNIQQE